MTTTEVEVSSLVSGDLAEMQAWTRELMGVVVKRLDTLTRRHTVRGEHRKQLLHALELAREVHDFLGPVETGVQQDEPQDELGRFLTDTQRLRMLSAS